MVELVGIIDGELIGCLIVEFYLDEIFRIYEKVDLIFVERYSLMFFFGNWFNYYGLVIMYYIGRICIFLKILNFCCLLLIIILIIGI